MKRLAALHAWPAFSMRAPTASFTTSGSRSVSRTMKASEPPSSRTTFLRCLPGERRDRGACALAARHRDATDARVRDDGRRLLVGGEEVDVRVGGQARVAEDLLHRQGRLRALRGVLEQDRVPHHEVRTGEPRDLVVGVVPRHDAQQRADRGLPHERLAAGRRVERLVRQQGRPLVGVVAVDVDRVLDLVDRLRRGLAHLAGDQGRQGLRALHVDVGHPVDQRCSGVQRRRAPRAERLVGAFDRGRDLRVAGRRELLLDRASSRIGDLVLDGHETPLRDVPCTG